MCIDMFARNKVEKVKCVPINKTTTKEGKDNSMRVEIKENSTLVQAKNQALGMVSKREDGEEIRNIERK